MPWQDIVAGGVDEWSDYGDTDDERAVDFAAAVEATASTGGQITPPIMGAAAFIMVEFLEIPYRDIVYAAMFPALLHYVGIFAMVHFEAKRLGLRGLRPDEMPQILKVFTENWLAVIPLLILMALILTGRTPDFAAVWGITACVVVGFITPHNRLTVKDLVDALSLGAKYALAVGAAAAAFLAAGRAPGACQSATHSQTLPMRSWRPDAVCGA